MARYIDADAIKYNDGKYVSIAFKDDIDKMPTADVVEVVRCKDCKFWQTDWLTSHDGYHYCSMIDLVIDGDFYCKDGERKILPKIEIFLYT